MKIKVMALSVLIGVIVLSFAYERSAAESKTDPSSLKIGIVNVKKIFQDSKKHAGYMEQAMAERQKIEAQLDKLAKEIEADKAGIKTVKEDSSEYMEMVKEILENQAKLQAQQEFYKRQVEIKDQRWTEQFYADILRATGEVAKEKGLDLVFENGEPELPATSAEGLMMAIRTHKLLYTGGCIDISGDVIARLDAEK